jgi:predicted XRE-type DNA-binding protein
MWEASEEEQDALREVTKAWLDQDGHSQRALATALGVAPTKLSTFLAGWGRLRTSEAIALHGAVSE